MYFLLFDLSTVVRDNALSTFYFSQNYYYHHMPFLDNLLYNFSQDIAMWHNRCSAFGLVIFSYAKSRQGSGYSQYYFKT